tara:strand:- start:245 stop:412 length:168 start_codon:yes stop_codon:yes gene_type:complete
MKKGDLVYEDPYPERGIVVELLKSGSVKILCPTGQVIKFSKEYVDKLVVVANEER